MNASSLVRRALAAGGLVALGVAAGCTTSDVTAPPTSPMAPLASVSAMLTAADVIVPGADVGEFANPIVANNSGWSTTEFWDNPSDDVGATCNVGFWATGTLVAGTCTNAAAGSDANQGGYSKYWGDGPQHRAPSSFMFKGTYVYKVTLLASYALEASELGWFTVSSGVYTFHPVSGWGSKTVGSFALIPAGADWGVYLKHTGHLGTVSCGTDSDCSDASGDMHGGSTTTPIQQFALFTNAGETRYLVGVEDNEQANVVGDDDFQDFILSVEPFQGMFVIGDVEAHDINDVVNFWGAQWWKNNSMSGEVSSGVAAFKGYAATADNFCGGEWSTLPGNSSDPPAVIGDDVLIIVTSKVLKVGSDISGDIQELLIVHQDGGYGPNPGHPGNGPVTQVVCELEE